MSKQNASQPDGPNENEGEAKSASHAKGGKARAQKLSPEDRKAIAKAAAEARWSKSGENRSLSALPQATHDGDLDIAGTIIKAAVLPNTQRLITQGTFLLAIGRSRTPKAGTGGLTTVDELPFFLQAEALRPFISDELRQSTTPIFFKLKSGQKAVGYDVKLLTGVCEVYLKFRDWCSDNKKPVPKNYQHIVKACDLLMRGFAEVGIIALVDEATGYQDVRDRKALQEVLRLHIDGRLYEWAITFPTEFFKGICRLKNWPWNNGKMPSVTGKYITDLIYSRLEPGLLGELQNVNPPNEKGYRKYQHHRFLTRDIGHPGLKDRVTRVIGMIDSFDDGEWDKFKRRVHERYPKKNDQLMLRLPED
jgi:hypothetical protein